MAGRLVIVGLGPGDPGLRTVATATALAAADRIILRTRIHPGIEDLAGDARVADCDDLYASLPSFDAVYAEVASRVVALATSAEGLTVFAVPGNPWFGERSVPLVVNAAREHGVPTSVLGAVSFLDIVAQATSVDPLAEQWQLLDGAAISLAAAEQPFAGGLVVTDPTRPTLVTQVFSTAVASDVKAELARIYPEEHPILVIDAAGVPGEESLIACALYELDRQPVGHLTSVLVPPQDSLDASRSPQTLQRIIARLRAPGGCPWDRKQTHSSLRQAVIEEAYEVVDAIDADDAENLAEELGDLLLQVALHAQIAEEDGAFTLEEVYAAVSEKLMRRHPHVFGDVLAETPGEVVKTWDAVKAEERAKAGKVEPAVQHPLDKLPRSMPTLERAQTLIAPRKGTRTAVTDDAALDAAGATMLAAVESVVAAGVDPGQALERALRQRFAPGEGTAS